MGDTIITTELRVPLRWSDTRSRWEVDGDLDEALGRGPIRVVGDEDLTEYLEAKKTSTPTARELAEGIQQWR